MIDEKLATYREDLAFVSHLADERHLDAADIERKLNQDLLNKKDEVRELQDRITERTSRITQQKEDEASVKEKLHELEEDKSILLRIKGLSDLAKLRKNPVIRRMFRKNSGSPDRSRN